MSEDVEELARDGDEPGAAPRRGSKLSSDAVVVLSTGAVLFTTMLAGFIGVILMISNLHETRENRLEVVREIIRDDVGTLDARIRAVEIGQANLDGKLEGGPTIGGAGSGK